MSLDDIFGAFPGRPQHEDFAHLSEIVLQQDGAAVEDADFDYGVHLSQFIDPASLRHMAEQRARKLLATMGRNPDLNARLVSAMAAMYLDAFMVGFQFRDRYRSNH
jgi:hypothetical protein